VNDPTKPTDPPKRQTLTLKRNGIPPAPSGPPGSKGAGKPPKPPQKPLEPPAPSTQCKLCGQFYRGKAPVPPTQPKTTAPYIEHFWLVMRSSGQRPKRRHPTLESA
jgi:hypothetical protein